MDKEVPMPFEVFNRTSFRAYRNPMCTIQKRGTFSLNAAAFGAIRGDHEVTDTLYVVLLFDRSRKLVGFRRASEDEPNAYPVRKQANSNSYLVAGKIFCRHYEIQIGQARRYKARDLGEGVVGFSLDDEGKEVSREG